MPVAGPQRLLANLFEHLVALVEELKVGDYYGNRQGYGQDSCYSTHGPDQLAWHRFGHNLTIAHRGHGDDGVPETVRYAVEVRVRVVQLQEVDTRGEYDHANYEEKYQEHEFVKRGD